MSYEWENMGKFRKRASSFFRPTVASNLKDRYAYRQTRSETEAQQEALCGPCKSNISRLWVPHHPRIDGVAPGLYDRQGGNRYVVDSYHRAPIPLGRCEQIQAIKSDNLALTDDGARVANIRDQMLSTRYTWNPLPISLPKIGSQYKKFKSENHMMASAMRLSSLPDRLRPDTYQYSEAWLSSPASSPFKQRNRFPRLIPRAENVREIESDLKFFESAYRH